jgi:hypothetical protein
MLLWLHFKHPSDNQIRRKLLGSWKIGQDTTERKPDGSYVRKFWLSVRDDPTLGGKELIEEGTWKYEDGYIITTMTNEPWRDARPNVLRAKVVSLNDHKMVLRQEREIFTNTVVVQKQ